jgi:hypothetical protein
MSEAVILPSGAATPGALMALAGVGPFALLYLGSDFAESLELRRRLPAGWTMLPVGECLNAAAAALRPALVELDGAVMRQAVPCAWWDATHLAERNPLASTLLLNLARFAVLRDVLDRQSRCLVLCDDRALCRLFYAETRRLGHSAGWMAPGQMMPFAERGYAAVTCLRALARGVRVRVRELVRYLLRKRLLRHLRRSRPVPLTALGTAKVLFISWAQPETFPAGATLPSDPYLPRLAETARGQGLSIAYIVRALPGVPDFAALAEAALACPAPALLLEEVASSGAIVAAALQSLLLPLRLTRSEFRGHDITALLRHEAWRELGSWDVVAAYGHFDACRRLGALGLQPAVVVHPYENQPWEKMLHCGLRRWLPNSQIIGVQHSPFAFGYLSLFPSRREFRTGLVPDRLLVPGQGYADWFRAAGYSPAAVTVFGAPRYEHARRVAPTGGDSILCCTGIELGEAIELATKAVLASRGLGHRLEINYHPVTDETFRQTLRDAVSRLAGDDLSHVRFVDALAGDLLNDARVVLYSTSAAAFDAKLAGRAAFYVRREVDLDLDKMPDELAVRWGPVEELRRGLVDLFASTPTADGADRGAVNHWLAPFDPQVFAEAMRGGRRAEVAA